MRQTIYLLLQETALDLSRLLEHMTCWLLFKQEALDSLRLAE